jgi:hypothetical protein
LRAELSSAAYAVVWPIVFARLTRSVELRRGHLACARSVDNMADGCLDRFHDDVEAAVEDLLQRAGKPIHNLEAWIATRLTAATVDAHRRRRGRRGALQRPRAPKWLCQALGEDPWLTELAIHILVWVGNPATAGSGLWPTDSWAYRRAVITDDWAGSDSISVERDVETVLAAMRRRPKWYGDYVERPLGRKQAPVVPGWVTGDGRTVDPPPLALSHRSELDDAHLLELATEAIAAIQVRLLRGDDQRHTIIDVLESVFGAGRLGYGIDNPPHAVPDYDDEQIAALLHDPTEVSRVVACVLHILQSESFSKADSRTSGLAATVHSSRS